MILGYFLNINERKLFMEKYRAKIVAIGKYSSEFTSEGVLVFFGKSAPEELQEYALVHDREDPPESGDIVPGNLIKLGDLEVPILAVGSVVNENIRNIGHFVIKFNGLEEPEMDGDITVPAVDIPEIAEGLELVITG